MSDRWLTRPLSELVDPARGICYGVVQPGEDSADGIPIVRVNDIRGSRIATTDPLRIRGEIEAKYARSRLRGGELLLTLVGTVGETAVVPHELAGWNTARAVGVLPILDEPGARWVHYVLRSPELRGLLREWCNTTVQATLNLRDVARLPITLPPKKEREAIEGVLSALDDKIELNRQTNETLDATARALFKSWFVDFDPVRAKMEGRSLAGGDAAAADLFPDSFEDSSEGALPRGWRYDSVYELCKVRYGAPYASKLFNTERRGFPLVRIRDLSTHDPEVFTDELHPVGFTVEPGELLVGMDGEFRARVWLGPVAVVNQRVCKFIPNTHVPILFLRQAIEPRLAFFERAKVGTTVIHLGKSDIDTMRVVVPPTSLLERFGALTNPLLDLICSNAKEVRALAEARDALLPRLLSGELRVRDAERVVEAAV